jgi:NADH:ubiquinone oxidoreductase subunit F (NADH-binding)
VATSAPVEVMRLPGRYIAGEESALVRAVGAGPGLPFFRPDKSVPLALGRHHALVHNVETLAQVALIARYGAEWFRQLGPPAAPGTCLVTLSGDVRRPGVFEVEVGTPLGETIGRAGPAGPVQAVLVGGYGGSWVSAPDLATPYAPAELRTVGATMGAGVLVVLRAGRCGLRETARIARFMAAESAGQCGPCLFGLPSVADDLELVADGVLGSTAGAGRGGGAWDRVASRASLVDGRGACRHPDGVARLVRSAMSVFAEDGRAHSQGRPCPGSAAPTVLRFAGPRDETGPHQP